MEMAYDTNVWNDHFCVSYSFSDLSNFQLNILMEIFQNILVIISVFLSLRFLYVKFLKKENSSDKPCGNNDCGC